MRYFTFFLYIFLLILKNILFYDLDAKISIHKPVIAAKFGKNVDIFNSSGGLLMWRTSRSRQRLDNVTLTTIHQSKCYPWTLEPHKLTHTLFLQKYIMLKYVFEDATCTFFALLMFDAPFCYFIM